LNYIYCGKCDDLEDLGVSDLQSMLGLANMYELPCLVTACAKYLLRDVEKDSVSDILSFLYLHRDACPHLEVFLKELRGRVREDDDLFSAICEDFVAPSKKRARTTAPEAAEQEDPSEVSQKGKKGSQKGARK